MVEVPVYGKNLLIQVEYTLLKELSIRLFRAQSKVEFSVFIQIGHGILERFECYPETADELERLVRWRFFN